MINEWKTKFSTCKLSTIKLTGNHNLKIYSIINIRVSIIYLPLRVLILWKKKKCSELTSLWKYLLGEIANKTNNPNISQK